MHLSRAQAILAGEELANQRVTRPIGSDKFDDKRPVRAVDDPCGDVADLSQRQGYDSTHGPGSGRKNPRS